MSLSQITVPKKYTTKRVCFIFTVKYTLIPIDHNHFRFFEPFQTINILELFPNIIMSIALITERVVTRDRRTTISDPYKGSIFSF